jgi:cytochrome c biogenesis protein CcmG/thiol:disulfide interchange protein DsbE
MKSLSTPLKALLLAIFGLAVILLIWESPHPFERYRSQPLPELALQTLEGEALSTKAWNNYRPRAYNVFASWCGPCLKELPQIRALNEVIPVYGIAVQDSPAAIRKLLKREGNPFTAVAQDTKNQTGFLLGVRGLPTTILVDKYGQIAEVYEGPISQQVLEEDLLPRIKKLRGK